MADVQEDIRSWLLSKPDWLQQATELLLCLGHAEPGEIETLTERLKTPAGQQVTTHRAYPELTPATADGVELRLLEIGGISGIENLGPRIPLSFGSENLCLVYGHNGSGKSGYTRILKRACGKSGAPALKSNVFQPAPSSRECVIKYQVSGTTHTVKWSADGPPVPDIRLADIFDSDAALSYLTLEAAATYSPPSVALFEALAGVCDDVKARLQAEQSALVKALPILPAEYAATPAANDFGALTAETSEVAVDRILRWSDQDSRALDSLAERLKAHDPAALAREKRSTAAQLQQLSELLRNSAAAFSQAGLESVRTLREVATAKRKIADEIAQMASAPLEGIGLETWRALWLAARNYSQVAYPGREFPVTENALCVLCQQPLGLDAQQRLRNFDKFVQSSIAAEASAAETEYDGALKALASRPTSEEVVTQCEAANLTEDGWAIRLNSFWDAIAEARAVVLRGEPDGPITPVPYPSQLLDELASRHVGLEQAAQQHDADASSFDRVKAQQDKRGLEARRWVSEQSAAIRAEIARLKQVATYEEWKRLASSAHVSLKAGEISEQVITQAYARRFNEELTALGASRIKVEIVKTRTQKGRALHRLRLKGTHTKEDGPQSVLSDGERRIVSLAAFLADVMGRSAASPFIFDDPISSLDQDFELHVATRLVELARARQVLVFTHRLSLLGAIGDAAKKVAPGWHQTNVRQMWIESYAGVAGHPSDQQMWGVATKTANNILLTRLDEAKRAGDAGGVIAYRSLAQGICSDFRKLLERTVEDDLVNGVVKRHRRSITTDNRLMGLANINADDCRFMDDLMTKYSSYEHSQSQEVPVFIPDEPELRLDLIALKDWRTEFDSRSLASVA